MAPNSAAAIWLNCDAPLSVQAGLGERPVFQCEAVARAGHLELALSPPERSFASLKKWRPLMAVWPQPRSPLVRASKILAGFNFNLFDLASAALIM